MPTDCLFRDDSSMPPPAGSPVTAARNAAVRSRWITDEALAANPGLVKTMSVKPTLGSGRVRLIEIEGPDLQPCGGTHVRGTGEIGPLQVSGIEKKGKLNRRARIALV